MSRFSALILGLFIWAVAVGPVASQAASTKAHLKFTPNPVQLTKKFTVVLSGAKPGDKLAFLATSSHEGFGSQNWGIHRANASGVVRFAHAAYKGVQNLGLWTVTVVQPGGKVVAKSELKVIALKKHKPKKKH
jgi:hypothetical protein